LAEERAKRKLSAILSADVKGYSRLMGEDELATVRTLEAYRDMIAEVIRNYSGRVVDSPGDNILAEFASVVDAVESAVEIQKELKAKNAELPENRRMEFRIGINLGDVIEEGERIYGDGVNVAARVEGLAEGGGICISRTAFDQVRNKLNLGYENLGEHSVKNIAELVRVYRVLMEPEAAGKVVGEKKLKWTRWRWASIGAVVVILLVAGASAIWNFYFRPTFEPASTERMAFPLPDKPSIAVLPFVNMSEDSNQEYLADGITENIISALSQVPKLFVIARNSTYTYKGKPVKVQKVAEDLGVQYVLEGSVQRSGGNLRITAQLIDAITGRHLWSERYDRELMNIFALQDEITNKIITALQVELTMGEQARLIAKGTDNLEAYLKVMQAREPLFTHTKEGNAQARRLLEEAIALDPEYPSAYALLGSTHFMDVLLGSSKSPKKSLKQAFELEKKAIALDDSSAGAHSLLGFLYILMEGNYDKAIAECERAIELAPNSAGSHIWMGCVLTLAGRHEEGVQHCEQALRLNPLPEVFYFQFLGWAYFFAGRYEEAIAAHKKELQRTPNDIVTNEALTTAYSWAGRVEEARAQAAEILRIYPKYSLEQRAKILLAKNQADRERWLEGLRKAGLPETPPLPLPDKPSIAVLPFVNISGDPKQEYLSDGITEQIITSISKMHRLFVIARTSSFKYKGKAVDVKQVSRELGVKYVLEGSVQRSGDRLRITAQLIDAITGKHLWAERYDRNIGDIFALQDEITREIIAALQVELTDGEQARVYRKGTDNFEAYIKLLQGRDIYRRGTKEDNILAREVFEEVISLDPEYAIAYRFLSGTYHADVAFQTSKSPRRSLARAIELAQKAISLDDSLAEAHGFLGYLYTRTGQLDKGIAEAERAVDLDPNSADAHMQLGGVLHNAGRREEAIQLLKRAIRLNPFPPPVYFVSLGRSYHSLGRHEEAIEAFRKALQRNPDFLYAHLFLASVYSLLGRELQARAAAAEVLRIDPQFSLERFTKIYAKLTRDPDGLKHFVDGLRKAGLK